MNWNGLLLCVLMIWLLCMIFDMLLWVCISVWVGRLMNE